MVIISINIVELESLMLHAKFLRSYDNWFWRRGFLKVLPYIGMAAILVM